MIDACQGFRQNETTTQTQRQKFFSLLLVCLAIGLFAFSADSRAQEDDPWAGVDDSISDDAGTDSDEDDSEESEDEEAVAESGDWGGESVEVDAPVESMSGDEMVNEAVELEASSNEKLSPREELEQRLYKEHGEYRERRNREDEEIALRQQIFHERSRYHIGLDFTLNDLRDFDFGSQARDATGNMMGLQFHYKRFPIATTTWGRVGIGGVAGVIGNNPDNAKFFKLRFFNLGPRISYEGLFTTGQIFVPVVFLGYEYLINRTNTPTPEPAVEDNFSTFVYGLGVYINLNRADPATGTSALVNIGVRKFDLAVMFNQRSGDTDARSSSSFAAGLRFEY